MICIFTLKIQLSLVAEETRFQVGFLHVQLAQERAINPKILFIDAFDFALATLDKLFLAHE